MLHASCMFSAVKEARPTVSITRVPLRGLFLSTWSIQVCFEAAAASKGECFCQALKLAEIILFKSILCGTEIHDRVFQERATSQPLATMCKSTQEHVGMYGVSYLRSTDGRRFKYHFIGQQAVAISFNPVGQEKNNASLVTFYSLRTFTLCNEKD